MTGWSALDWPETAFEDRREQARPPGAGTPLSISPNAAYWPVEPLSEMPVSRPRSLRTLSSRYRRRHTTVREQSQKLRANFQMRDKPEAGASGERGVTCVQVFTIGYEHVV